MQQTESGAPGTVRVTVNQVVFPVAPGTYAVARLKSQVNVPPQDNLEKLVDEQVVPLDDNGEVTIVGHEAFVSFPRTGRDS